MTMACRAMRYMTAYALIGLTIAPPIATAQDAVEQDVVLERLSTDRPLAPEVAMRLEHIRAELDVMVKAHPWAGEYVESNGRGYSVAIALASRAGVVATHWTCMGLSDQAEGGVTERRDGSLVFDLRRHGDDIDSAGPHLPRRVLPVQWSGRRYLLGADSLVDFVNAVHHGQEPRHVPQGRFLLGDYDHLKPVDGPPPLPGRYRRMLLSTPQQVAVLAVGEPEATRSEHACQVVWPLRLDAGRRAGLFKGMTLAPHSSQPGWSGSIIVTDVRAGHANAQAQQLLFGANACEPEGRTPAAGWLLSTGAFDPQRANVDIDDAARRAAGQGG